MESIRKNAETNPYALYLDLHAPTPGDPSYGVPCNPSITSPALYARSMRLSSLIEQVSPPKARMRADDFKVTWLNWHKDDWEYQAAASQWRMFGCDVLTLETAYHKTTTGEYTTRESLREYGAAVAMAIGRFLTEEHSVVPPVELKAYPYSPHWLFWYPPRAQQVTYQHEGDQPVLFLAGRQSRAGSADFAQREFLPVTADENHVVFEYRMSGAEKVPARLNVYLYRNDRARLSETLRQSIDLEPAPEWTRRLTRVTVPEGADLARIGLTLSKLPGSVEFRGLKLSPHSAD